MAYRHLGVGVLILRGRGPNFSPLKFEPVRMSHTQLSRRQILNKGGGGARAIVAANV